VCTMHIRKGENIARDTRFKNVKQKGGAIYMNTLSWGPYLLLKSRLVRYQVLTRLSMLSKEEQRRIVDLISAKV
jgi:hypothetical protein